MGYEPMTVIWVGHVSDRGYYEMDHRCLIKTDRGNGEHHVVLSIIMIYQSIITI